MTLCYDTVDSLWERYDAFLVDQFGVLMSGSGPFHGAADALSQLGKRNKPTIILSNSGKRSEPNCARLVKNGFGRGDFLTVLTSGEIARVFILNNLGRSIPRGGKVVVLIRNGDDAPLDGVDLQQTDDTQEADLLLIVSRDPTRQMSAYGATLKELAARNVPCLCLNPDLMMLTPEGLMASAGRIAQQYQQLGGPVRWFGKPHAMIYDRAKKMLGSIAAERILCVGDSLSHDIKGGRDAGCKTALVRTGVHAELSDDDLAAEVLATGVTPDHFLRAFSL